MCESARTGLGRPQWQPVYRAWMDSVAAVEGDGGRTLTDAVASAPFHLFAPRLAYQYGSPRDDAPGFGDNRGHQIWRSITAPYRAEIAYHVRPGTTGPIRVTISDAEGEVRTLNGTSTPGINRVYWNFQGRVLPRPVLSAGQRTDSVQLVARMTRVIDSLVAGGEDRAGLETARNTMLSGGVLGGGGGGFGGGGVPIVGSGSFLVSIEVGGVKYSQPLTVEGMP